MAARAVVVALALLVAVAALDAFRPGRDDAPRERVARSAPEDTGPDAPLDLVPGRVGEVRAAGTYLRKRVVRDGRPYLSEDAVADAFPLPLEGPFDIAHVAVAPDGTLVLAVYGFSPYGRARGAIELWRGREPLGAFVVPSGSFGGGLAFSRDGELIATFGRSGDLSGVFDRRGREVSAAV